MFLLLMELGGVGQEGVVVRRVLRQLHPKVFQYLSKSKRDRDEKGWVGHPPLLGQSRTSRSA